MHRHIKNNESTYHLKCLPCSPCPSEIPLLAWSLSQGKVVALISLYINIPEGLSLPLPLLRVSSTPGWLKQTHYRAKSDLELLVFLSLPLNGWHDRHTLPGLSLGLDIQCLHFCVVTLGIVHAAARINTSLLFADKVRSIPVNGLIHFPVDFGVVSNLRVI